MSGVIWDDALLKRLWAVFNEMHFVPGEKYFYWRASQKRGAKLLPAATNRREARHETTFCHRRAGRNPNAFWSPQATVTTSGAIKESIIAKPASAKWWLQFGGEKKGKKLERWKYSSYTTCKTSIFTRQDPAQTRLVLIYLHSNLWRKLENIFSLQILRQQT